MSIFELSATSEREPEEVARTRPVPDHKIGKRIVKGTDQQEQLWHHLVRSDDHAIGEALAGCGKSSSSREGMWRMLERNSGQQIKYAVYNKAMAEEFQQECPPLVQVGTCHSFGFASLRSAFGSTVEKLKTYMILDTMAEGQKMPRYLRRAVSILVSQSKNQYSTTAPEEEQLLDLLLHYSINTWHKEHIVVAMALRVLQRSAEWTEIVDFDDMIWLPVIHGTGFPDCDTLFIDEAQDWNHLQHELVGCICPSGRVVVLGDRHQAIYSWRGADVDSIPNLERQLTSGSKGVGKFPLTITFRCPKSHVDLARNYVPEFQAHESNPDGVIERDVSVEDMLDRARPGDRVICPTNAPVVRAALRLIAEGKRAIVRGRGLGEQLNAIARQCERGVANISGMSGAVQKWRERELESLAEREGVEDLIESVMDRSDGLQAVLLNCDTLSDIKTNIDQLFSEADQANAVNLSTVHRVKGLEADTVYFLDQPMRKPKQAWEEVQQRNVRYVALTRSRNRLVFVNSER